MRVGVVGAGFAGLSAASRLRETGHEVEVFEARHRVGGRVWSQELIPGDPRTIIERGAEFVLDGYERMHAIAGELGLSFADMSMSYYVREPRNGSATTLEAISACAERVAKAAAMAPWGTSLADVVADLEAELDSAALTAYISRLVVTNGCPEDRLAATNAADMTVGFTAKPSLRVIGGNQAVAIGMAERLGDAIRLNTVVSAIDWDRDEVRLRTVQDETPFDFVVLAVPLAVARELHFDPMLPEWKLHAWERSGLGQAAKLHIPMRGDAGYGAVQDVSERFWTWTATDGTGLVQPVLHCFAGSAPALSQLQVDSGPQTWANRVAQIRPELDLDLENAIVTTWSDDRYAREAYSAVTVDVAEDDDNLMSAPVGALHFAGEHTAGAWAGLMEGAIRSGERAADELLR